MFGDLPIRTKLTAIMMLTTLVCLALAGAAYVVRDRLNVKSDMIQEMTVLADVIANRSTAALVFDDRRAARENLAALAARKGITYACILTPDGELFAAYSANAAQAAPSEGVPVAGHEFGAGYFLINHPIMLDDVRVGTLCIRSDLHEFKDLLRHQIFIGLGIFGIVGVFAFLLSSQMQKSISTPLADLARTAAVVAQKNDYSVRAAENKRGDELGRLVTGFNDMLGRIESSNAVLREQEIRFRQMAEASPEPLVVHDKHEKFIYMNQKFVELFGYTRDDLPDVASWWPLAYPDEEYRRRVKGEWYYSIEKALRDQSELQPQEAIVTCKDGSQRIILFRGAPVGDQFMVLLNDLTKRVVAEKEKLENADRLRQAQKMEAIGTLAGGIAHDFNNILAAIFGYTELARENLPPDSPARNDLSGVLQASKRARDLVQQILMFSRARGQALVPVAVPAVLDEALGLIRAAVPATITIEQDIAPGVGPVQADPTSIHQVIMNLCTNAAQAMKVHGGSLRVVLDQVTINEEMRSCGLTTMPGQFVRLEIADSGPGLDPSLGERIFEPYFTTKGVGEGTGMGLAVVHGILSDLKGRIEVESVPGRGARFRVFLPVFQDEQDRGLAAESLPASRGRERLLFVDDEVPLVEAGTRMLERLGYQVTPATSSAQALDLFSADPEGFDLVITDQTMPRMTGLELAQKLLGIRPGIRIILCSGYNAVVSENQAFQLGLRALAAKPLSRAALARLVREALDGDQVG